MIARTLEWSWSGSTTYWFYYLFMYALKILRAKGNSYESQPIVHQFKEQNEGPSAALRRSLGRFAETHA